MVGQEVESSYFEDRQHCILAKGRIHQRQHTERGCPSRLRTSQLGLCTVESCIAERLDDFRQLLATVNG